MTKSIFTPDAFLLQNKQQIEDFLAVNPEFYIVLGQCIADKIFLEQFCELTNLELPKKLTPIEKMIDEVTGHTPDNDEFCLVFIGFVHFIVWQTLSQNAREEIKRIYAEKMATLNE